MKAYSTLQYANKRVFNFIFLEKYVERKNVIYMNIFYI